MNNALVWECSKQASKEIDYLIQKQISSRGNCEKKGFESHACQLKRSQEAFKTYVQTECTWNMYGPHYEFCEMMLKKNRLEWLDKSLGSNWNKKIQTLIKFCFAFLFKYFQKSKFRDKSSFMISL